MKSFLVTMTLLASMSAMASEIKIFEIAANNARGMVTTRFEVNTQDGTAGVSATVSRQSAGGRHSHRISHTFEAAVPELSLNGSNLEFNKDGVSVVCGTMGVTRIFKIPTLKLSGKCDVVAKRVNGKVVVSLVTE